MMQWFVRVLSLFGFLNHGGTEAQRFFGEPLRTRSAPRSHSPSFPASPLGMHTGLSAGSESVDGQGMHSQRGRWERVVKCLLMLALLMGGSQAWAKFEFIATDGGVIDLHTIPDGTAQITHEFTARFRACEGTDCATGNFANYRLAISSDGVYDASGLNVSTLDDVMDFTGKQPEVISLASSVPATPGHASITPKGGWTHGGNKGNGFGHGIGVKADYVTATFKVKLNVEELKAIALTNDPYLRFYVNGEETSQTTRNHYYHSEEVKIKLNYPAKYRVSGLQDIGIVAKVDPVVDGYYQEEMDFCIYVSRNPYEYKISVYGQGWSTFDLTSGSDTINYDVQFGEKSGSSVTWDNWTSSPISGEYKTNGHMSETCNNYTDNNASLRVRIPEGVGSDGIYKDTVTVEISAT